MLLGVIAEVTDLDLVISLPSNMTGHVAITEISDPVTAAVERAAHSNSSNDDADAAAGDDDGDEAEAQEADLPDLARMFSVGQVVRCVVVSTATEDGKPRLRLSLRPSLTNTGVSAEHLIPGYVRSCDWVPRGWPRMACH